jgi:hypothetical protein
VHVVGCRGAGFVDFEHCARHHACLDRSDADNDDYPTSDFGPCNHDHPPATRERMRCRTRYLH